MPVSDRDVVQRRRLSARRPNVPRSESTADGMSCTSVPPAATFSTWAPRQIASSGRSADIARRARSISNSSRPGSASSTWRMALLAVEAPDRRRRRRSAAMPSISPSTLRGLSLTSRTRGARAGLLDRREVVVEPAAAGDANGCGSVGIVSRRRLSLLPARLTRGLPVSSPTSGPARCSPSARARVVSWSR